ncbi:hypothetical protein BLNAU_19072 [Blattamonas nauphoetae]|uniref:Uncharacterized protein n=1 Tax=Blattamonas nauphoetae TaxID=2049346 RepID=A0ABQ9X2K0_9EUKA|nr:hypothetical protein BLNAU_19072 [Blattamonas nauphoetae]
MSAASTLLGHLSALCADPSFSLSDVGTMKLLIRIASSLATSEKALYDMRNCLPLTLLVAALAAVPPSHYLHILNIYLEFCTSCRISIEIQEPFVKRLFAILRPDARSEDTLLLPLSKLLTKLASPSSLWSTLLVCISSSEPSSKLALYLLAIINTDRDPSFFPILQYQVVPRIASFLLQDVDELALSFLISVLGNHAHRSTAGRLEEDEAQRIVEKLLEIEQRHPLHTDTQETEKTTTVETTLSPLVDGKGEAVASARTGTSVNELVDVWRVMRMAVSSLAGSPSGLERLHVFCPLIFQQLKERGNALLSEGGQSERI